MSVGRSGSILCDFNCVDLKRDPLHIIRCERRLVVNGETLRKRRKAGTLTVLSEIRTNFESDPKFGDVSMYLLR